MKVYIVIERYHNDEGEWINIEKVFSDLKCAKNYRDCMTDANKCNCTSYEVLEWDVE